MPTKIIYVFVTYLIFGICLSASNVPYGSLASAVSQNPTHRVSLSTYRSVGAAISGASTGFIIPIVMYSTINGKRSISGSHFFFIAIVCATLAFIAFLLVVHFSVERVRVEQKETLPALVLLKGLAKNRALIVLLIVDLFIVVNQSIAGTTTTYLFNDYFKNKQAMSVALLFTYGTVIVLAPFAAKLTARFGKKESSIVALVAAALLYICMYLLHITNPWVYLALLFVATLGAGMFNIMIWAFYTDVIDYQQYKTGLREDGTVYGVNSFGRKVAQALSGAISGFMLTLIGYQSSTTGGAVQSVVVQQKIYTFANLLPVVCLLGAAIILFFGYPLNKKNTLAMQADLERRL
jgi:GPH family glycoside/pentoside/hexuronide:cation symporter